MNYRKLGRTGIKVAPLCLGGNVFGWTADQTASFSVLDGYVEGGGNFIDTANVYSRWAPGNKGGESETVIGAWMKARGNRDKLVIATKAGGEMGPGPNAKGLSRRHILQSVEDSLKRLQTDYIDLYQSHFDDPDTAPEETLRAYDDLVSAGKIRAAGASNFSAWRVAKSLWTSDRRNLVRYECIQPGYNLLRRDEFERELEALCVDQEVSVITYYSLASGFLSGKYRKGQKLPDSARAGGVQSRYMNDKGFAVLDEVEGIAKRLNSSAAQVALAWILARSSVTSAIVSATSAVQLKEILGAAELRLSREDIEALDTVSDWKA